MLVDKSSGDIPEVAESDDDFPEYIPLPNRGRLFSQMSDTEQLVPVKKRKTGTILSLLDTPSLS